MNSYYKTEIDKLVTQWGKIGATVEVDEDGTFEMDYGIMKTTVRYSKDITEKLKKKYPQVLYVTKKYTLTVGNETKIITLYYRGEEDIEHITAEVTTTHGFFVKVGSYETNELKKAMGKDLEKEIRALNEFRLFDITS